MNPSGLEGAKFGDETDASHRAGDKPFAGGTQQDSEVQGVVAAAKDEAISQVQGDFRQKSGGSQESQAEKEDDKRGDQFAVVDGLPHKGFLFATLVGIDSTEDEDGGAKQGNTGKFDNSGDLACDLAIGRMGKASGDDLRGGVDRQAAPFAVDLGREQEKRAQDGEEQHRQYAEQVDGGNGNGDVFFFGLDDGCSGNNGRTPADGSTDADEQGKLVFDFYKSGEILGRQNDESDDESGAEQNAQAHLKQVVKVQTRAKKDDAQRQDFFYDNVRTGFELCG